MQRERVCVCVIERERNVVYWFLTVYVNGMRESKRKREEDRGREKERKKESKKD